MLTQKKENQFNRIKSWLMGSAARKPVHHSGCPVLVVRGPQSG